MCVPQYGFVPANVCMCAPLSARVLAVLILHAWHASVRVAGCCLQGRGVYVLQDAACMAGERTCSRMLLAG